MLDIRGEANGSALLGFALTIQGDLDAAILCEALQTIAFRHEMLRTGFLAFAVVGNLRIQGWGQIRQVFKQTIHALRPKVGFEPIIISEPDLPFRYEDLRSLNSNEQETLITDCVVSTIGARYDYARPPLGRAVLLRTAASTHRLIIGVSHLVFDAWSLSIFRRELAVVYQAYSANEEVLLEPLAVQYLDFAYWQRQQLQGEQLQALMSYWTNHYSEFPPLHPSDLPFFQKTKFAQRTGALESHSFDSDFCQQLRGLAASTKTTLYMLFLMATMTVLSVYSDRKQITVASYFANRTHPAVQHLIGDFATPHRLGIDFSLTPRITDLLSQIRSMVFRTLEHQDIPIQFLMNLLKQSNGLGSHSHDAPWITCEFISYKPVKSVNNKVSIEAMSVRNRLSRVPPPQPLRFICRERGPADITISIHYHSDAFQVGAIQAMLLSIEGIFREVIRDSNQPVSNLLKSICPVGG